MRFERMMGADKGQMRSLPSIYTHARREASGCSEQVVGSALERLGSKNGWKILLHLLFNTCPQGMKQSYSSYVQPVLNLEHTCDPRKEDAGVKAAWLCGALKSRQRCYGHSSIRWLWLPRWRLQLAPEAAVGAGAVARARHWRAAGQRAGRGGGRTTVARGGGGIAKGAGGVQVAGGVDPQRLADAAEERVPAWAFHVREVQAHYQDLGEGASTPCCTSKGYSTSRREGNGYLPS